jgi:hypothetical protein
MTRLVSYALTALLSIGFAYAVATSAGKAIGDSLNQSAALIADPSSAR